MKKEIITKTMNKEEYRELIKILCECYKKDKKMEKENEVSK